MTRRDVRIVPTSTSMVGALISLDHFFVSISIGYTMNYLAFSVPSPYLVGAIEADNWTIPFAKSMTEDFVKRFPRYENASIVITDDKQLERPTFADAIEIDVRGFYTRLPSASPEPANLASVRLTKLDTNCGVAIVGGMWIMEKHVGIGKWFMAWVLHILSKRGFTIAIGTTNDTMEHMETLLTKFKWKEVPDLGFINARSARTIKFWRTYLTYTLNVPYLT